MVNVVYSGEKVSYDRYAFFQWDYGRTLIINGLDLPNVVQIHFARKNVPAVIMIGETVDGVTTVGVPDSILQYQGDFNVYIFKTTETTGYTYKTLYFSTKGREKPVDYDGETEPSIIDQMMNKLNQIIDTGIASYIPDQEAVNQMIQEYVPENLIANNDTSNNEGLAWSAARGKKIRDDFSEFTQSKGEANGIASLDETGKVPATQLPAVSGGNPEAVDVAYDNETSGLSAENTQDAIDELSSEKLDKTKIANNLTTTEEGFALDARQGKALNDNLTYMNYSITPNSGVTFTGSISKNGKGDIRINLSITGLAVSANSGTNAGTVAPTGIVDLPVTLTGIVATGSLYVGVCTLNIIGTTVFVTSSVTVNTSHKMTFRNYA